jgi:hypothetical protein
METSSIILLVVSASISFGIGRAIQIFRNKKKKAAEEETRIRWEQALRDRPPGPPSKNKAKRKRQLQQASSDNKNTEK